MKKRTKILIILSVVLTILAGSAVSSYAYRMSFGIKGGIGLTSLYDPINDNEYPNLAGGLMLTFDLHFRSYLTFEINLGWRTRGVRYDLNNDGDTADAQDSVFNVHFFDFELLAKFYLTPRKPAGFYLLIGGYVGGPLTEEGAPDATPPVYTQRLKTSDVGMTFGGGVNIGLSRGLSLLIETYGTIGFKTVNTARDKGDSSGQKFIAGYVMAGILFDF